MRESDFNRIIAKSFEARNGFGYKIPDPPKEIALRSGANPFDGMAAIDGSAYWWETKLNKGYSAFAFSKIRDHQIEALRGIHENVTDNQYPIVIWAVYEPRKTKKLFVFDIAYIIARIENGDKSIKKKEVEQFEKDGLFVEVNKEDVDVTKFKKVMITNGRTAEEDQSKKVLNM